MRPIISPHIYTQRRIWARSEKESQKNIYAIGHIHYSVCAERAREGPPSPWLHLCQKKLTTHTMHLEESRVCYLAVWRKRAATCPRPNNNGRYPLIESMRGRPALCSHSAFCRRKITHVVRTLYVYAALARRGGRETGDRPAHPPLEAVWRRRHLQSPPATVLKKANLHFFLSLQRLLESAVCLRFYNCWFCKEKKWCARLNLLLAITF
jgi:hypothetical protein